MKYCCLGVFANGKNTLKDWYTQLGSKNKGVGSILVAILPSCQYIMNLLHHNCIDMNIIG